MKKKIISDFASNANHKMYVVAKIFCFKNLEGGKTQYFVFDIFCQVP